jgi:hypothetical protein
VASTNEKSPKASRGNLRQRRATVTTYVAIAAGAFVAAVGILLIMLFQVETLVRLGLVGNLYYVVLVPLGLAVAAFLFGVLRSYAVYSGAVSGGTLELGGPIVAFTLVVILGFYLNPSTQPFGLTVFVHGEKGLQDIVLQNAGSVLLDLGGDRRRERIGDKGQAHFVGIPTNFRGQAVAVAIDAPGFELVAGSGTLKISGDSAYLAVRAKAVELSGYVRADNSQPIAGATVSVAGSSAHTDASGYFKLMLPGAGAHQSLALQVTAQGYRAWNSPVVPGGSEIAIVLDRGTH